MAFLAIGDCHFSRVRFMALGALRDLTVDVVACGTVQGSMLALVVPELIDLPCMAGKTSIGNITPK